MSHEVKKISNMSCSLVAELRKNVINLCSELLWKDLNCSHVVFFGEMWPIKVIGIKDISAIITLFLPIIDR